MWCISTQRTLQTALLVAQMVIGVKISGCLDWNQNAWTRDGLTTEMSREGILFSFGLLLLYSNVIEANQLMTRLLTRANCASNDGKINQCGIQIFARMPSFLGEFPLPDFSWKYLFSERKQNQGNPVLPFSWSCSSVSGSSFWPSKLSLRARSGQHDFEGNLDRNPQNKK